jgi:hypothetical protein
VVKPLKRNIGSTLPKTGSGLLYAKSRKQINHQEYWQLFWPYSQKAAKTCNHLGPVFIVYDETIKKGGSSMFCGNNNICMWIIIILVLMQCSGGSLFGGGCGCGNDSCGCGCGD